MTNFTICDNIIIDFDFHCNYINGDQIYKSYALQPITQVYSEINQGKEVYFLDSENKPVRVKSITKEDYEGKIYDVDVENDVVLVRRNNSKGVWSGNSDGGKEIPENIIIPENITQKSYSDTQEEAQEETEELNPSHNTSSPSSETNETEEEIIITIQEESNESEEIPKVSFSITGKVITKEKYSSDISFWSRIKNFFFRLINIFRNFFLNLTGLVVDIEETEEVLEVTIDDNATEYEIEYETPAPIAIENETDFGKQINVSSEVHYENVLSYAWLLQEVEVGNVKLYEDGLELEIDRYDTNENGLVDYIEWTIPNMSEHVYDMRVDTSKGKVKSYGTTWERLEDNDIGKGNLVIYSGIRSVKEDGRWKDAGEARSLKDKEGIDITILEEDPNFPLDVLDFNYTSITLNLTVTKDEDVNKNIDLKIKDKNETIKKTKKVKINGKDEYELVTINLDDSIFNNIFEWGYNSTIITVTGTTDVEDAIIAGNLGELNFGATVDLNIGNAALAARTRRGLFRFKNIATRVGAGATIEDAQMYLYCSAEAVATDYNIGAYRIVKPWVEGTSDGIDAAGVTYNDWSADTYEWGTAGCANANDAAADNSGDGSGYDRKATAEDSVTITVCTGQWYNWDLTSATQNWYDGSWNEEGVFMLSSGDGTVNSRKIVSSSEKGSNEPYLNITYTVAVVDNDYPVFSDYWDNNASLVGSGTGLFNVTLLSTNGTVWLEIGGVNYIATNLTESVYNASVNLTEGVYSYIWHSWGNGTYHNYNVSNTQSYTINNTLNINFTNPTLPDATTTPNTSIEINVSLENAGDLNSLIYNWNGTNYTIYDDISLKLIYNFDNVSALGENDTHVVDHSGHCYDNETEILTDEGWKLFSDLNKEEEVATLNQDTGELEWQIPYERQEFDNYGEMYRIETEEEDLLVSEKHRVYSSEKDQIYPLKNIVTNSDVVNTLTNDCCLRCGSLDQIKALVNNASARYGESFGSGNEFKAFIRKSLYSDELNNLIDPSTSFCLIPNSCSESFDLDKQRSLYFSSSGLINSGAINSALIEENKYEAADNGFISEKNILLSNTSIILIYPYFFLSSRDIEFSNSFLIFGDTSESNLLNEPFLAFLPSSTDHLINSCSSLEFNLLNISCLLNSSCLTSSERFIQISFEISDFNLSSTANVIDAIYIAPLDFNSSSFLSSFILSDITLRANSATFISGKSFLKLANNSSGTDTVTLGILNPSIYFNKSKAVQLYKSFDPEDFELQPITQVYEDLKEGKQVYFLDSENNPIRVKSITKEDYDGKIYDVDVENDVVLVRRKGDKGVWSGNSNNGTAYNGAVMNLTGGKYAGGFEFDGVDDYVGVNDNLDISGTTNLTVSFWVKHNENIPPAFDPLLYIDDIANNPFIALGFRSAKSNYLHVSREHDGSDSKISSTSFSIDEWNHVAVVVDASSDAITLYVNGKESTADDPDDNWNSGGIADNILVGMNPLANNFLNGSIDEVRIWNRALSAAEIYQQYASNLNKYDTDKWTLYVNQSQNATDGLDEATYTYQAYATDDASNYNETEVRSITVSAAADNEYPVFSNYWDNNATLVGSGTGLFNVTLLSTNGTVLLEINNTNYTATNVTASVYNASAVFSTNGTYTYRWHSWGNGTSHNYNVSGNRGYSVNATANTPPQITHIFNDSMTDLSSGPNEAPSSTSVIINFTAYDLNGASDLNSSTAQINFTMAGEEIRQNLSCYQYESSGNYANYTCNVTMWWWDRTGTWSITSYIEDNSQNSALNDSTDFYVGLRTSFTLSPGTLTWPGIAPGQFNITSTNDPLVLNNTGNDDIATNEIGINGTNLLGETDNNYGLWAGNFSVAPFTGGVTECNSSATTMSASVFTNVTGSILAAGNYTKDDGTAQEQLYFCIRTIGSELISQAYSTSSQGAWTIRILLVLVTYRRRKKKQLESVQIPLQIFNQGISPLEAICKYMKEKGLIFREIAELLNRDERTIWTSYKNAIGKREKEIKVKDDVLVSTEIFRDRRFSVLESLVVYLKDRQFSNSEIAKLLGKDQRNTHTVYIRAVKKGIKVKKIEIPVSIFNKKLGALESVVRYMKDDLRMSNIEIAKELNRDPKTTWTAYNKSVEKQKEKLEIKEDIRVPIKTLKERDLTILESIVIYLRNKRMKYSEIGELLDRDQRNIWTVYSRALKRRNV
ncbi:MAG: LamG-like jellyroll fold domain-containing protein [archaeon]